MQVSLVLVFGYALAVINLLPRLPWWRGREALSDPTAHGWPFTYMLRAARMRGSDFHIYYAPWPQGNPPLVEFRPAWLILNVLLGSGLAVLATIAIARWLRTRRNWLRFSLRTLMICVSLLCAYLAMFREVTTLLLLILPNGLAVLMFGCALLLMRRMIARICASHRSR